MMIQASVPLARSHEAKAASDPAPSPSAFKWVVNTARRDAWRAFLAFLTAAARWAGVR